MSFDNESEVKTFVERWSQSLSSRAMSFDSIQAKIIEREGDVSIPFEQGDVFRQKYQRRFIMATFCLNPFRAGRCLSTVSS